MSGAITVVPAARPTLPVPVGAGLTHRGAVRERNEDSILTDPTGRLWAVADGMGGYGHGDVASDIVIDCLETIDDREPPLAAPGGHRHEQAQKLFGFEGEVVGVARSFPSKSALNGDFGDDFHLMASFRRDR